MIANSGSVSLIFTGIDPNGKVNFNVQVGPTCDIEAAAQILMYMAATNSPDGFEKALENMVERAMGTDLVDKGIIRNE